MNNTIYCRTCGKELSAAAFMCPNCGTPVNGTPENTKPKAVNPEKTGTAAKASGLSVVSFILTAIAFVTGIIFGAFFYVFPYSQVLLYVISATTVIPALTGMTISAYLLCAARNELTYAATALSIASVILSAIALLFLFLTGCILASIMYY